MAEYDVRDRGNGEGGEDMNCGNDSNLRRAIYRGQSRRCSMTVLYIQDRIAHSRDAPAQIK